MSAVSFYSSSCITCVEISLFTTFCITSTSSRVYTLFLKSTKFFICHLIHMLQDLCLHYGQLIWIEYTAGEILFYSQYFSVIVIPSEINVVRNRAPISWIYECVYFINASNYQFKLLKTFCRWIFLFTPI